MDRRIAAGLIAVVAIGAFVVSSSGPAFALNDDEAHLLSLLNNERTSRSLTPLADTADLATLARLHSREMAHAGKIYHSAHLENEVNGCWTLIGENVGVGPSVEDVHTALMNSPHHRENILESYNQVGLGVVKADDGEVYITQTFAQRMCARSHPKMQRHVRAQVRRTPPPRAVRPHLQSASSIAATSMNVDLLVRMVELDTDRSAAGS